MAPTADWRCGGRRPSRWFPALPWGTGGHVYPALAIAEHIVARLGDSVNCEFAGTRDRMEWEAVQRAGFAVHPIPAVALRRPVASLQNLLLPFRLLVAVLRALHVVARLKPHAVIGTGGYVSFPTCVAAWLLRRPVILQEQNAVPGIANRLLSHLANCVCIGFPACADRLPQRTKKVVTGNPVRSSLSGTPEREAKRVLGVDQSCRVIAVFGGSLGSTAINESMIGAAQRLLSVADLHVVWATGADLYGGVSQRVARHPRMTIVPYLKDMGAVYSAADLVVARAGAMTCSELIETQTPAVLVPLPSAADNHQTANALSMACSGAAVHLPEDELSSEALAGKILGLMGSKDALSGMQQRLRTLLPAQPATEQVAAEVLRFSCT